MHEGTSKMPRDKGYKLPSSEWEVTAQEAANILVKAEEIKAHKVLNKEALAVLRKKKKAIEKVT